MLNLEFGINMKYFAVITEISNSKKLLIAVGNELGLNSHNKLFYDVIMKRIVWYSNWDWIVWADHFYNVKR